MGAFIAVVCKKIRVTMRLTCHVSIVHILREGFFQWLSWCGVRNDCRCHLDGGFSCHWRSMLRRRVVISHCSLTWVAAGNCPTHQCGPYHSLSTKMPNSLWFPFRHAFNNPLLARRAAVKLFTTTVIGWRSVALGQTVELGCSRVPQCLSVYETPP